MPTVVSEQEISTVLLVDDLPESLGLLERALHEAFPKLDCWRAESVAEANRCIAVQEFGLALVDLGLPDGSGIEIIATLCERQPQCTVVVATIHADDAHLFQALQAGAQGYLLKDQASDMLGPQLRGICDGQPPLSPAIARRLLRHFQPLKPVSEAITLSQREREVLALLAQGERLLDIAMTLSISRHTVGDHVKNIYRKLNISSRAEAALQARTLGLV